jgi:hypothetical protein
MTSGSVDRQTHQWRDVFCALGDINHLRFVLLVEGLENKSGQDTHPPSAACYEVQTPGGERGYGTVH